LTSSIILTNEKEAQAQDATTLQSKFIMTTDISLFGNYLTYNAENKSYDLEVKWPIENHHQWNKLKYYLDHLPQNQDLHNPLIDRNKEVIIFIENNPDQISGEDMYFSENGSILRVKRTPQDVIYSGADDFYKFLKNQMEENGQTYSATKKDININAPGLVIIFRGNTTLTNPSWIVTDKDGLKVYLTRMFDIMNKEENIHTGLITSTDIEETFDRLNTFMIYTNIKGMETKLISVNEYGRLRSTKIKLEGISYKDDRNFFSVVKRQALDELSQKQSDIQTRENIDKQNDF